MNRPLTAEALASPAILLGAAAFAIYASATLAVARLTLAMLGGRNV